MKYQGFMSNIMVSRYISTQCFMCEFIKALISWFLLVINIIPGVSETERLSVNVTAKAIYMRHKVSEISFLPWQKYRCVGNSYTKVTFSNLLRLQFFSSVLDTSKPLYI